jgi:hypothetical protein
MTQPLRLTFALLLGASACTGSVDPDNRARSGSVGLSRAVTEVGAAITGSFRSVVDSVALSITAGGAVRSIGRRIAPGEVSASLPITLPAGVATIGAQIWSNNATLLYTGDTSAIIDNDGFSIDVPLTALTPVLVVFPDTLKVDSVSDGIRFGSLRVRNSGNGILSWGVTRDTAGTGAICGNQACSTFPTAGRLSAGQEGLVTFAMPALTPAGAPFPAGTFTYRFTSAQGTVVVQWRYPASP